MTDGTTADAPAALREPTRDEPRAAVRSKRMSLVAACLRKAAGWRLLEPEVLGLEQLVRPGDVCVDVGAAYGMYSYPLAHLVGPLGAVHSFEPQRKAHALQRAGSALAGAGRIHLTRSGVGRVAGEAEIVLPIRFGLPIHGHAHIGDGLVEPSRPSRWHSRTKRIRVPVTTIDEVCAARGIERVHFIKVDVEGFEPGVVQGAAEVIRRDRPSLLLEIEDRHLERYATTAADFAASLLALGYAMHVWRAGRWQRVDRVERGTRNYLFATDAAWGRTA
ncbi:FkbM family methyltransferase [Agrococcus sp. Marseille-P2731]|uniref:FkbM family methyltransferase n=1 Tax=Agrococcus sp. Marseille-P2731 TaxID=1841862 RepID=UPI0013565C69|nr:FkbM family methyltransferase [Agrococcus sp. Marseille-P2731]